MTTETLNPFRIPLKSRRLAMFLESLLHLEPLARYYDERPSDGGEEKFLQHMFNRMGVSLKTLDEHQVLENIPKEGPLLVVANHPLGCIEGLAITYILRKLRPDLRVMTNKLLTLIPECKRLFIGVDIISKQSERANYKGLREADKHLQSGGCLLVFPAGKVAAINIKTRRIEEHPWNRVVGRMIKHNQATCLPIHVEGYNSYLFYFLGLFHPSLRTLMLPRELVNKKDTELTIQIGKLISPQDIRYLETDKKITDYLRICTELIGAKHGKQTPETFAIQTADETIDAPELVFQGLENYRLVETDKFDVYCAPFDKLDAVMKYVGMAREFTFRAAGVGTGNNIDSDEFDPYYLHLFAFDKIKSRLVGGYRIGRVDEILKEHGVKALYSRTTYHYDEKYLEKIERPLEIGRSFVHPDYQRHLAALDILWRGIGAYVAQNQQYHTLFGGVSISREHSDLARILISECMLESFSAEQKFLEDIKPVAPIKIKGKPWTKEMINSLNHIAVVNKLVGRCDSGKVVPALLRHYLALNGKFVCFSLNKGFNNSFDGLILVDLRKTPKRYLERYLGKDKAEEFLRKWKSK